jgi:hypothetical protein
MPTMLSSGFDLATIEGVPHRRPRPRLEEIAPGVLRGDVPTSIIDAAGKANQVLAEVFDRLGRNEGRLAATPFAVRYGGATYTSLEELVLALAADRHSIEVRFEHRAANFANLKTRGADGHLLDVPVALMMRVDFEDGTEARVPAVHSEMVIRLRGHRVRAGPRIDADVHWYQGISGTGFFPADLLATPRWCGRKVVDSLEGKSACRAVALAGLLGSVIDASAVQQQLALGGYGWTGVCNDSVGVIQYASRRRTTAYPLFMRDATLAAELTARTEDGAERYHVEYARLKAAIAALPGDVEPNASAYGRAFESIPWANGEEPFQSTVEAKRLLSARLHAAPDGQDASTP